MNNCLCFGVTLILVPKLGADELGDVLRKTKPNYVCTVPSALFSIVSNPKYEKDNYGYLHSLIVGADKLDETFELK